MLPFKEKNIEDNLFIRIFDENVDNDELVWHRDREDRYIYSPYFTDWQIQLDNNLPQSLNSPVFIEKNEYHRLIKGTNQLEIILIKVI